MPILGSRHTQGQPAFVKQGSDFGGVSSCKIRSRETGKRAYLTGVIISHHVKSEASRSARWQVVERLRPSSGQSEVLLDCRQFQKDCITVRGKKTRRDSTTCRRVGREESSGLSASSRRWIRQWRHSLTRSASTLMVVLRRYGRRRRNSAHLEDRCAYSHH